MALRTPPMFLGQFTVTLGENDKIEWSEENGGPTFNLTEVLAPGTYYPLELALLVASGLTAESAASGVTSTYTCVLDVETGKIQIASSVGTFQLALTATETAKFLTGGDVVAGTSGAMNFGFEALIGYDPFAASVEAPNQIDRSWFPNYPPRKCDQGAYEFLVVESSTPGGSTKTYNFSTPNDRDLQYLSEIHQDYGLLEDATRTAFIEDFLPYAMEGSPEGRFRYYDDRDVSGTYEEMFLSGDSASKYAPQRTNAAARWAWPISMRRYKS